MNWCIIHLSSCYISVLKTTPKKSIGIHSNIHLVLAVLAVAITISILFGYECSQLWAYYKHSDVFHDGPNLDMWNPPSKITIAAPPTGGFFRHPVVPDRDWLFITATCTHSSRWSIMVVSNTFTLQLHTINSFTSPNQLS